MSDILVEISDRYLPRLAKLYEEKAAWAPSIVALIHTGIQWKQSEELSNSIKFFSPNNCWEEDGTIIVVTTWRVLVEIYVFTFDEHCINLYKGLTETKMLDADKHRTLFYAIHEKFVPTVKKYIEDTSRELKANDVCFMYAISPDEARRFEIECPPDVVVKKLEPEAVQIINESWPHRFEGSEHYLAKLIEINRCYGVFLKETNRMVGWLLRHILGNMTMLHIEEDYRRKGYASLLVQTIGKEIGEEGHWPFGTILVNNQKSLQMFEKLGFRNLGKVHFVVGK